MKKDIKFRDSSVLNLILVFNLLNFLKYRDISTLFHNGRVTEWNVPVKPANNSVVEFVDTCIMLS